MVRGVYNLIGTRGSIREGEGYLLQAEYKSDVVMSSSICDIRT